MSEWLPIEGAPVPHDGLYALWSREGGVTWGYWNEEFGNWWDWTTDYLDQQPTHYLPQPVPPEGAVAVTDAQKMWMLRLMLPPPTPVEMSVAQWQRSKGKPFLTRLRLSFSTKWIAETLDAIRPPLGNLIAPRKMK